MIEKRKIRVLAPNGLTLLEVLISLLVFSFISLISFKVVAQMGKVYEKIKIEENNQRGISNSLRLLEKDFGDLNYYNKKKFIENFMFHKNELILPNGVVWKLTNGSLGRFGKLNSQELKEIILLKNIAAFKLGFWEDGRFVEYKKNKNFFLNNNKNIGVEIQIVQNNNQTIRKVIILKGIM